MEGVEIQWTASGKPLRVRRAGRVWTVVVEPVCWFEWVAWWRTELRAPKGEPFRIEVQVWQVQVTLGSPASEPVTWQLMHHPQTGGWQVRDPGWPVR
ncbi:hypothetical protein GCM10009628_38380 [Paeniglutamicibacter kerguelensis]